jgi:hypothetical protein
MELYNTHGIILYLVPCDVSIQLAFAGNKSTVLHDTVHSDPATQQRLLATSEQAEMLEIEGRRTNKYAKCKCLFLSQGFSNLSTWRLPQKN